MEHPVANDWYQAFHCTLMSRIDLTDWSKSSSDINEFPILETIFLILVEKKDFLELNNKRFQFQLHHQSRWAKKWVMGKPTAAGRWIATCCDFCPISLFTKIGRSLCSMMKNPSHWWWLSCCEWATFLKSLQGVKKWNHDFEFFSFFIVYWVKSKSRTNVGFSNSQKCIIWKNCNLDIKKLTSRSHLKKCHFSHQICFLDKKALRRCLGHCWLSELLMLGLKLIYNRPIAADDNWSSWTTSKKMDNGQTSVDISFFLWFSCIIKNLLTKSTTTPKRRYACIGTIVGLKHSSRVQGHFSCWMMFWEKMVATNIHSTLKWSQSTWNKNFLLLMIGFLKYPTFLWFEIHVQKFYSHSWNNKSLCNTVYQRKTFF